MSSFGNSNTCGPSPRLRAELKAGSASSCGNLQASRGYYVFDSGNGAGGSITLFDSREAALASNEKAMAWIRASLADLIQGEPEITVGEVLANVKP